MEIIDFSTEIKELLREHQQAILCHLRDDKEEYKVRLGAAAEIASTIIAQAHALQALLLVYESTFADTYYEE